MTKHGKHTIGLMQYELVVNSRKQAIDIQNKISEFSKNEFPHFLNPTFNKHDKKDISFVIDSLEIDLGTIEYEEFKLKYREIIKNKLSQKLEELLSQPGYNSTENQTDVKEKSDYHIIEFFLLHGNLPWYVDGVKIDLRRITKKLIKKKEHAFSDLIRQHIWDINFQSRLQNIIPENTYKDFFSLFTIEEVWETDSIFMQYLSLHTIHPFTKLTLESFRLLLFESIIEVLSTDFSTQGLDFEMLVFTNLANKLNLKSVVLIKNSRESLKKLQSKHSSAIRLERFFQQIETRLQIKKANIEVKEPVQVEKKTENKNTSFLIFNSGLVLLHPYLNELFEKLELIRNKHFVNENAQFKAIRLLQYAVNRKTMAPEHILILNKILCGIPVNRAIPWFIKLSKREKTLTTRMISATINNWSALKNTSTGAFRKSFLQRKGILKEIDDGWQLQVERTSYDVLLSRIPWQYEQIELAWMNSKIQTAW